MSNILYNNEDDDDSRGKWSIMMIYLTAILLTALLRDTSSDTREAIDFSSISISIGTIIIIIIIIFSIIPNVIFIFLVLVLTSILEAHDDNTVSSSDI
jgi:ABC-type Na+ efflux pump permease subunit